MTDTMPTYRHDPALRPGERLETLPDGRLRLVCNNGKTFDFTVEEWAEYSADYLDHREPVDVLDWIMGEIAGRDIIPTSEVLDLLLDLRPRLVREREALLRVVNVAFPSTITDDDITDDDTVPVG